MELKERVNAELLKIETIADLHLAEQPGMARLVSAIHAAISALQQQLDERGQNLTSP